jgi:nucleotide-binding universal stress UspA family protein
MTMVKRPFVILAAIAFDETGVIALQEAARLAQDRPDAELHLVHVMTDDAERVDQHELLSLRAKLAGAPAELQRRVNMLALEQPLRITAHLRAGTPSTSILQSAIDIDADMIVVGTRRRRGFEKLIAGSVAERVLRHARCPVLIAMPKDQRVHPHDGIEPPCADCSNIRRDSSGTAYWCERHSRARMVMHLYETSDPQKLSVMR